MYINQEKNYEYLTILEYCCTIHIVYVQLKQSEGEGEIGEGEREIGEGEVKGNRKNKRSEKR